MRRFKPEDTILVSQYPQLRGEIVLDDAAKVWQQRNARIPEHIPPKPQLEEKKRIEIEQVVVKKTQTIDTLPEPKAIHEQQSSVKASPRRKKKIYRAIGNTLIGASLFGVLFFGAPMIALELRSAIYKTTQPFFPQAMPSAAPESAQPEFQVLPPENQRFRIRIPMIGVESDVIANVDTTNEKAYEEALKKGVAHAAGSGLPGEENAENRTIFIFAHSTNGSWNITRYNALFYSLKDMSVDDQIQIWFWGKEYWYKVTEKNVVEADDVALLKPQKDEEKLVLQTCWPPGTTWKRLLIVAKPVQKD